MHIHMIYLLLVLQLTFVTILFRLALALVVAAIIIYDLTTSTIIAKVCVECNARALHPVRVRDSAFALHHI